MFWHRRFPDLEFETQGVMGAMDLLGSGDHGDLATLRVSRIASHERSRTARLTFHVSALREDGEQVELLPTTPEEPMLVGPRETRSAGIQRYLPVGEWAPEPFRIQVTDVPSGRSVTIPYAGRVRTA